MIQSLNHAILRAENLTKIYRSGEEEVVVFEGLNFEVRPGELVALVGESGAGKTTLLHLLAALDTPTRGEVYFEGQRLSRFGEEEQGRLPQSPHRLCLADALPAAGIHGCSKT